jgi:hypothetical protein
MEKSNKSHKQIRHPVSGKEELNTKANTVSSQVAVFSTPSSPSSTDPQEEDVTHWNMEHREKLDQKLPLSSGRSVFHRIR